MHKYADDKKLAAQVDELSARLKANDTAGARLVFENLRDLLLNPPEKPTPDWLTVDIRSLYRHEHIAPETLIKGLYRLVVEKAANQDELFAANELFGNAIGHEELDKVSDYYTHSDGWTNRLIQGDSLLVMTSLLEREGMTGQVQCIYLDPPYGIKYGSNWQIRLNNRTVKDGDDDSLSGEPEQVKAFRDTWELGIHSYLSYLRERLLVARQLLHESGSCFVQISDENVHLVRNLMDEVFGSENFVSLVSFQKTGGASSNLLPSTVDYLIWYAKEKENIKFRPLYQERTVGDTSLDRYDQILLEDGTVRRLTRDETRGKVELPQGKRFQLTSLLSDGETKTPQDFEFRGKVYRPRPGTHWKTTVAGLKRLQEQSRIEVMGSVLRYRRFLDDFPVIPVTDHWESMQVGIGLSYVVQTATQVIERCLLMTTDPGDLVLDPTCGSGTTAYVAEQWGRRWITCDTSRVAITLAKQRLMTAVFDYYTLAHSKEGVGSGFKYKTVPHVTLKSIANNPEIVEGMSREAIDAAIKKYADQEVLYDQPEVDRSKARVTGPFTYEAVPAINVRPIDDPESHGPIADPMPADQSITRSGVTSRQDEWRDELARTGVRGKGGAKLEFLRLEPLPGTRFLHAVGETKDKQARTVAVSFGPEYAPLEQRHVELAWEEARSLKPKPEVLLFAAFHFDPEAAKDIDELDPKKAGMQLL